MGRTIRDRRSAIGVLACLACIPSSVTAQVEVTAGVLVLNDPVVEGTLAGPTLALSASLAVAGVPVLFEAGVGRTDFTSLGQDYHNDHYFLAVSGQWEAIRGCTGLAFRLGAGAYGEYQTVETDPPTGGGDNWSEIVVPGVMLTRAISSETRLVLTLSDAILGPVDAILDPDEYAVEHRLRIMLGLQL